jgi:hypothetical protein
MSVHSQDQAHADPLIEASQPDETSRSLYEVLRPALESGLVQWDGRKIAFRHPQVVNDTDELMSDTVVKNRQ